MANNSESEDSANNDSYSSSSSDYDEDDEQLAATFNKDFFKTLSSLKAKDPAIYDSSVRFFNNETTEPQIKKKTKEKPLLLKDYERDQIIKNKGKFESEENPILHVTKIAKGEKFMDGFKGFSQDECDEKLESHVTNITKSAQKFKDGFKGFHRDEEPELRVTTIAEGAQKIKDGFKGFLQDESDEEPNEFGGLLKKRSKSKEEKEKDEADYIKWLKGQKDIIEDKTIESELMPLHDYWNSKSLDKDEQYLKDFILNKRFLEKDNDNDDGASMLSEDGRILEAQAEFEEKYNFRYEKAAESKHYPRVVEDSLRRKDNKRSKKREEVKERKKLEKEKKQSAIKMSQQKKLKEIEQKLDELKKLTGNEQCGFDEADILEDFDPEKHDKKMGRLYNDEFYEGAENEKPIFSEIDCDTTWNQSENVEESMDGQGFDETDDFNMDCEANDATKKKSKSTRTKRKKKSKKVAFSEITTLPQAIYDPKVHDSFQQYIDEYYNLDCEDFIDDIPCKYKYKSVQPNDYGLTVEEILMADDKELNKWCPLNKVYKTRTPHVEVNEAKIYKRKAEDIILKSKILPSLFKSAEGEEGDSTDEGNRPPAEDLGLSESTNEPSQEIGTGPFSKSNKKQKNKNVSNCVNVPKHNQKQTVEQKNCKSKPRKSMRKNKKCLSSRLCAYGIKPRNITKKIHFN